MSSNAAVRITLGHRDTRGERSESFSQIVDLKVDFSLDQALLQETVVDCGWPYWGLATMTAGYFLQRIIMAYERSAIALNEVVRSWTKAQ